MTLIDRMSEASPRFRHLREREDANRRLVSDDDVCLAILQGEQAFARHEIAERDAEIARLRDALRDSTEAGLIYWDPQTSRGAERKAAMTERNRKLCEQGV